MKYKPIDYRIAIADACGITDFRETVLQSNSNAHSAIYYRKHQLAALADFFDITTSDTPTKEDLYARIRTHLAHQTSEYPPPTEESQTDTIESNRSDITTDGGIVGTVSYPADKFAFKELISIATALDISPDPPYAEVEMRRLAGSSIAGPYLAKLIEAAYVDLYLSANVGSTTADRGSRAYYPHRLEPVHEIPESATSYPRCYRYIVDSSFNNPEYDNKDVFNAAERVGADSVILADELHDIDGTIEAVLEGLDLYKDHEYDGDVMIPLQPPHDECFNRLKAHGIDTNQTFAIGGLKDASDQRKIKATESLREAAGEEVALHGLGFGVTEEIARAIRETPSLLDSLDYSTPVQQAIGTGANGEERLSTVAATAGAQLIEDLRKISPLVDSTTNKTLADF